MVVVVNNLGTAAANVTDDDPVGKERNTVGKVWTSLGCVLGGGGGVKKSRVIVSVLNWDIITVLNWDIIL